MKQIPNLLTLLNLVFGCLAIIFTLQNGIAIQFTTNGEQFVDIPEKIWIASLCIALAAVIDFLDGFVARLLKAGSAMGRQLDSLADVVSFGVAPGIILYQFLRLSFAREEGGMDVSIAWLLPALIFPCAAAYRLAKFNIDDTQQYGFKGVPSPAAGLMVASLPLIYWMGTDDTYAKIILNKWLLYAIIITVSYLMISSLPMLALKFTDYSFKNNMPKLILLAVAVIAALLLSWLAVPVVFVVYILLSLLLKNKSTQP
jgi:CDP-diacylglycerol---serine O-phosphatidyltransferase